MCRRLHDDCSGRELREGLALESFPDLLSTTTKMAMKPGRSKKWRPRKEIVGVYFAGGPQFIISDAELKSVNGQIIATAENGHIEGIASHFGKGKVAVSGFHPEANGLWKSGKLFVSAGYKSAARALIDTFAYGTFNPAALWESSPYFQFDPDGNDYDYAIDMIKYATSL